MKLLEYKAKELFEKYDVPTMKGVVIDSLEGIPEKIEGAGLRYPVVVKAQVQIGGRGKAGGIQFADNAQQAAQISEKLLFADIRGLKANELLIVEKASLKTEWYLSIMLDRQTKGPLLIFSPMGGMDIEETARTSPDKIAKVPINPLIGIQDYTITYALDRTGADKAMHAQLKSVAQKLYRAFFDYSCMLIEINPLGTNEEGNLIALDLSLIHI